MIILNFILSFVIILTQLAVLFAISSLIISLVNKTIGKQRRLSVKDFISRNCLINGFTGADKLISLALVLLISFLVFKYNYASATSKFVWLALVAMMLAGVKSKISSYFYLVISTLLLVIIEQENTIKTYISHKWLSKAFDLIVIEYSLTLKAASLVLAIFMLKDTFMSLIKRPALSGIITSSILTIFIIKENFMIQNFPFVLTGNLEAESFTRSLTSYGSVCMHYISIYLVIYLYVFVRKRPIQFINKL